jgi:hypothetical protein
VLATLVLGALAVAACGGDDDGAANEYSEAMAASMAEEDLPFDQQQIDCLSVEFVDAIGGPERLEEAGIEPDDLSGEQGLAELGLDLGEEEAQGLAASFSSCDVSLVELVLDEAGDQVPEGVRDCVEQNLDEDALAEFFAIVLVDESQSEEPPPALLEPIAACF